MLSPDVAQLIAAEKIARGQRYAEAARLARIARGCPDPVRLRAARTHRRQWLKG